MSRFLKLPLALTALVVLAALPRSAVAFNISGERWRNGDVPIHLQLGPLNAPLLDGAPSWGAVAESALSAWNSSLTNVRFTVVRDSTAPTGRESGANNVFWSPTIYGDAWDNRTLAITLTRYDLDTRRYSEADVLFNSNLNWNSYRGSLRTTSSGAALHDFRRVALHEFGHALGLNHPDGIGQNVAAVMNALTSNTDALTADDIAGARAIYDNPNNVPLTLLRMEGSVRYVIAGSDLNLVVDAVVNKGDAPSATIRLELWAMPARYSNGLPGGSVNLGTYTFPSTLQPGASFSKVDVHTTYTAPPAGSYYVVLLLTEFAGGSGSGTAIRDSIEFATVLDVGMPAAPSINTQPAHQTVNLGTTATFTVQASGALPLSFQWRKNGTAIAGATNATLTLTNVQLSDAGSYSIVISNHVGTRTSDPATLSVINPSDPGRLINLSILTDLTSPGDVFTMGYVVGGHGTTGTKPILVRAAGPTLGTAPFNLSNVLADPKLELFSGRTAAGENNNWGGTTALSTAFAAVGAFGYTAPTSLDAAVLTTVPGGDNSVRVSAQGDGTGTVLAELYDSTPAASFTATTPRLINVSVLKPIGSGLTVGFVIRGSTPRNVLIRAIGPGIAVPPFNVPGVLEDPQLTLFAGQTSIGSNDNWGGTAALSNVFTQVGAFALPAGSRDAALLTSLSPGPYTVQITGVAHTTGTALVEVYEAP